MKEDNNKRETNEVLVETIRRLIITKRLNFLIGSGTSSKSIPLMGECTDNNVLKEKVKDVSKKLITQEYEKEGDIVQNLKDYTEFIQSILNVINLSNSRQTPKSVNIFTTNYDLYIEKAIDELGSNRFVFNDGAKGYFKRILDSSNFNQVVSYKGLNDNYISEIPSISLIKPHGSINWCKENSNDSSDNIVITNSVQDNPSVVVPSGQEEKETYLSNHYYSMLRVFQLELDKPQTVLIVIGFSFQDKHIAKMVKRALQNPELIVMVFGWCDDDREKYVNNLNYKNKVLPGNLKIFTPQDFNKDHLTQKTQNSDEYNFELSNLTDIISAGIEESSKNDNTK